MKLSRADSIRTQTRSWRSIVAIVAIVFLTLTGCSSEVTETAQNADEAVAAFECPAEAERKFAKTRFVADIAIAAGTFHRYIYRPYKEGKFEEGAEGRWTALAKAAGIAALDAKLVSNAIENAKADPTLCSALGEPLVRLQFHLNRAKSELVSGDMTTIASIDSLIDQVKNLSGEKGMNIQEIEDENQAITEP